jgi:hypothetical protein
MSTQVAGMRKLADLAEVRIRAAEVREGLASGQL